MITLESNVRPEVSELRFRGPLDPWTPVRNLRLMLQPSSELEQFLEEQRDPSSPNYQRWLTPEEFGDRFGVTPGDLDRITSWLVGEGFTIDGVARARNWVKFSGTAGQIERTFRTRLGQYRVDGEMHVANDVNPSIPAALAGIVSGLRGLDDFTPKPQIRIGAKPEFNSSGGSHYLAPSDLATIYNITALHNAGFDGTGQKIVVAGQTNINISDIRSFRSQFGLPAKDPQMVLVGTDPGIRSGDVVEAALDLEWAGAVAKNATIIFVYSQNVFDSVQDAIDQNLAPVISVSYGACELGISSSYRSIAQQANAQGITWLSASGDSGAAGCDYQGVKSASHGPAIIFPANIPEVTAVGGTEFNEGSGTYWNTSNSSVLGSAMGYIPEKAWNDTPMGSGIEGTGGGASVTYAKPWWQTGTGVPAGNSRYIPDVSLTASGAHDGYLIVSGGSLGAVGGTSASTPSFAGIVALLNQYLVSKGVQPTPGVGNINPTLYKLAQGTSGAFHDITVGNNVVPCTAGTTGCSNGSFGFQTGTGYDPVTGLGSVDAFKLASNWATLPPSVGTAVSVAASPTSVAQNASLQLTAMVKAVSGTSAPTGSVTFSWGSTSSAPVALSAGSGATATATATVPAGSLSTGSVVISAAYSALGNFSSSNGTVTVSVTAAPAVATTTTVTANPTSIATTASTQLTATVKPASGTAAPTGSVKFSVGSTVLGTVTVAASGSTATAGLSVKGSSLAAGANSISVSYVATGNFSNSSGSVSVTVTVPPVSTTTSVAADPASISTTGTTTLTATVVAASGSATPTGSVSFMKGSTSLGSAPVSGGKASLAVKASSLATGANSITASYTPTGNFTGSTGSVSVTVTAPAATTTTVSASPTSIATTATTTLTATVKTSAAGSTPTGNVTFAVGSVSLGSAAVSNGSASLSVKGTSLSIGSNTITATFAATGNFANSSGTATVTVTAPAVATTTTVTASPTQIASSATTQLTATVKAASGSTAPGGSVSFSVGSTSLGSATLTGSGGTATATLTVKGSSLASGSNVITVAYSGASAFASSTGSVTVSVTAATSTSNVVATASAATPTSKAPGFWVTVKLQEMAGVSTNVTGLTINGTDFSSVIGTMFGSATLPAKGTLSATLDVQWNPLPSPLVFVFSGTDAKGAKWSQTTSIATH